MSNFNSKELGIIACPGGEKFAEEVIHHVHRLHKKHLNRKLTELSTIYNIPVEEMVTKYNLSSDLISNTKGNRNSIQDLENVDFRLPVEFTHFANGEFKAVIKSCVRGMDLYIIQDVENHYPIFFPNSNDSHVLSVNDHLMCVVTLIDAAVKAGAASITLILPAFPYSRQHKRRGREALTAAWFARMCEFMGVSRIITLDIHSTEIENSCKDLSLENLHGSYQIMKKLSQLTDLTSDELVIVSPDTGAIDRNKFYAVNLQKTLAMLYKERDYSKVTKSARETNIVSSKLIGDVAGKNVFMADDMLGTGGTLIAAMKRLKELGANKIFCGISLPLFTGNAIENFDEAYKAGYFDKIIATNAVYHDEKLLSKEWYESASVAELFAQFISKLQRNKSTSPLLENGTIIQKFLSMQKTPSLFDENLK